MKTSDFNCYGQEIELATEYSQWNQYNFWQHIEDDFGQKARYLLGYIYAHSLEEAVAISEEDDEDEDD